MSTIKLMFREGQWVGGEVPKREDYMAYEDELYSYDYDDAIKRFKPIAPQDQERVKWFVWNDGKEIPLVEDTDFKNWVPNSSKLYDCGDLEFEFKWIRIKSKSLDLVAESKQFWVIVEKVKEITQRCHDLGCGHALRNKKGICCMEQSKEVNYLKKVIDVIDTATIMQHATALRAIRALCEEALKN